MAKALWGGRFKKGMHPALKQFSYSLGVDGELLEAELRVNQAWVAMLAKVRLITRAEAVRLKRGLAAVARQFQGEALCTYLKDYEDVHTLIQDSLEKKIGLLAKKLHTGRSRNDLVVTSTRLWLKGQVPKLDEACRTFQRSLVAAAKKAGDSVMAGMTHLKKAQPVLMAHHLLAYVEMLQEDRERLGDALGRIDVLVLGSGALSGSSLALDQRFLARELGFARVTANSMAGVSDRAFLAEAVSALALLWMHLSRLSEDFILWNSEPFGYVELDDAFATGSSLMPHKKNPDVFELTRGRSAVIFSALQTLLVLQKGLPLAYNRDLQEDKAPVFMAVKKTLEALEVLSLTVQSVSFNRKAMEESTQDDGLYATDVLEYLVRKGEVFAKAHETVGRIVRYAHESRKPMRELSVAEWKRFSPKFQADVYRLFEAFHSVHAKKTLGSTQPALVKKAIVQWERALRK